MKRKIVTKIAAVILTVAMTATTLVGCGETSQQGENSQEQQDSASTEAIDSGDPFEFASVSDVTFPLKEKLELTVFVYAPTTGGGTYQDNYVTDWIEEKTNIHLNFVYDVDGDDAKTNLNLVMTDPNNLPDIFLATGWTKAEVQSYGEQGLLLPLDDYLKDAPNWTRLNEVSPAREGDLTMADGKIYTYGASGECFHCAYQNRMWIYMPWVEKLNNGKVPETTEELYEYLMKVKTQDPNGNGIADEVPMTGYIGGWATDPTVWLINSFVECNNPLSNTNPTVGAGLVVNDGKVEYSVMKDAYREGLRYMNSLYKEGLLDNQTFTQDDTQYNALLSSEDHKVAAYACGGVMAGGNEFWSNKDGEWQDWQVFEPVEGPDGVRLVARSIQSYFGNSLGSVSSNCKYPEIAVALFDFMASEEGSNVQCYGAEGVGWNWTNEGTSLGGGTPKFERYVVPDDFDWIAAGFKKDYPYSVYASDASIVSRDMETRNGERIADPDHNTEYYLQSAAEVYSKYAPDLDTLLPDLVFEGQDAQTISEKTLTIGGYVNQSVVQFITGDMDIDKDWDNYISTLKDMGVDEYLNIYQKYYDEYKSNLK